MRKQKAKWDVRSVGALMISITLALITLGSGVFHYQPYAKAQAEQQMKIELAKEQEIEFMLKSIETEVAILQDNIDMKKKIKTIDEYFNKHNSGKLKWKGDVFVAIARLYNIDPFRMVAISVHETTNGTSYAAKVQKNICGMNWSYDELKLLNKLGYNPDIYNIKVYGSVDECITSLGFKLRKLYKDQWGLETLTEIQTRYAPTSDTRQGLDGMDNTIWAKSTIKIYRELEAIYNKL